MFRLKPRLKALLFIGFSIILFQLLFNFSLAPIDRVWQGIISAVKISLLSLLVFWYTAVFSPSQISRHFHFLPQPLPLMFTLTLALIPALFNEAKKIHLIQISRGYSRKNPFPILIPLLHRVIQRSQHLALVMTSRGYCACTEL